MVADVDIEALGLLDGLEGDARRDRAELITWLLGRGFGVDQIRASRAAPMLLPANRAMGDDGVYVSAREVCEATGIDLPLLQRLQRAVGLPRIDHPDEAALPRADAEAVARAKVFLDLGIGPDDTVAILRVLVEGLDNAAARLRQGSLTALLRPGSSEIELAEALEEIARQGLPALGPMMQDLLLMRIRHSFAEDALNAAERAAGTLPGARQVTVAFADVAGFTMLGEAIPPEDLERVASQLTELAHDVAVPPVRFVKTIGDAVMLVCFDAAPLLDAVLDLAGAAGAISLPSLRIGVATGLAVSRAGDWFGSAVNIASRVTAAARPGTALVAQSTRDAVGDTGRFEWSPAGARRLKGLRDEIKLFGITPASPGPEV